MIAPLFEHTKIFFLIFGVVAFIGGLAGFVRAHSVASLVAGGISGVLLILGAVMLTHASWQVGAALDLIVSLGLLGRFGPALVRQKFNPAGYLVPLALIGVVLTLMIFLSPAAHP